MSLHPMRRASLRILNFAEREEAALGPKAHRTSWKEKTRQKIN
jgi:hypothetical protein